MRKDNRAADMKQSSDSMKASEWSTMTSNLRIIVSRAFSETYVQRFIV